MKPIKTSLLYRITVNNVFIILIAFILTFIGFSYPLFYIVLVIYILYVYLKHKTLGLVLGILCCAYFLYLILLSSYLNYNDSSEASGMVRSVSYGDYYNRYIISQGFLRYGVIDSTDTSIKVGDIIKAVGTNNGLNPKQIEYGFSEHLNYLSNRYVIHLSSADITVMSHKITYLSLKESLTNLLNRNNEGSSLMLALLLGDHSYMEEATYNSFSVNGITHLFAVSGLHVDMFITILDHMLKKLKLSDRVTHIILTVFLITYMLITQLTPSIIRAGSLYILKNIFSYYHLRYTSLDRLSLIMIIMIIINPLYLFKGSFTLSFLSSGTLMLMSPLVEKYKGFKQSFYLSLVITIITLPYSVYYNQSINLLTPLWNVIFIALVSYIIFPLTLLTLVTPHISLIQESFNVITSLFYKASLIASDYQIRIELPYFTLGLTALFYGIILFIIFLWRMREYLNGDSKKTIITQILIGLNILILTLTLLNIKPLNNSVTFLDVYQGDATLISINHRYYLIDTGRGDNNAVTKYLLNHNIKQLEALIITHNDSDHNGEYTHLKEYLKIKKLIINYYDDNIYNLVNTVKVKAGDTLTLKDLTLTILAPLSDPQDSNETSLVFTLTLAKTTFLFTGDSPYTILETLDYPKIDILKVAHHGSQTGTSAPFLAKIKGNNTHQAAVIMSGHISTFGFPHSAVLSLLYTYQFNVYCTKELQSITYNLTDKTFTALALEKDFSLW